VTWFGENRIETASGLIYDYCQPGLGTVTLDDIAHGLGNTCRFGGHTVEFYSVAQHSVLTSWILEAWDQPAEVVRCGLMHDAHEAYLGDLPRPLKQCINGDYDRLSELADSVIAEKFGLSLVDLHGDVVKKADMVALIHEAKRLLPSGGWPDWEEDLPGGLFVPTYASDGKRFFLDRARELGVGEVVSAHG
jgi:hypothetical protein